MDKFSIEIVSKGEYNQSKEYKIRTMLSDREYLALVTSLLDFLEKLPDRGEEKIVVM